MCVRYGGEGTIQQCPTTVSQIEMGKEDNCRNEECGLLKGVGMFRLLNAFQQPYGRGKYCYLLSTDEETKVQRR